MDWRLILLFIALVKGFDLNDSGEDSGEDEDYPCSMDYYDHEDSESCQHEHFPLNNLMPSDAFPGW